MVATVSSEAIGAIVSVEAVVAIRARMRCAFSGAASNGGLARRRSRGAVTSTSNIPAMTSEPRSKYRKGRETKVPAGSAAVSFGFA
jgi:hypothetical protein